MVNLNIKKEIFVQIPMIIDIVDKIETVTKKIKVPNIADFII